METRTGGKRPQRGADFVPGTLAGQDRMAHGYEFLDEHLSITFAIWAGNSVGFLNIDDPFDEVTITKAERTVGWMDIEILSLEGTDFLQLFTLDP